METLSFGALSPKIRQVHFRGASESLFQNLVRNLQDPLRAQWLIEMGAVYVNSGRVMEPQFEVTIQDVIRVHLEPKRYVLDKGDIKKRIVFENDHFLIVDKPSGLPMHPTLDNFKENLASGFDIPVHVTHRLDVPTSGICLLAKTKKYQSEFNKIVSRREIKKFYVAWVQRPMDLGLLEHKMKSTMKAPKEIVRDIPDGTTEKYEECRLEILSSTGVALNLFELKIALLTGRTHQIRAQLAFEGSPIIGDEMYGGIRSEIFGLHACQLEFKCPLSGEDFRFTRNKEI